MEPAWLKPVSYRDALALGILLMVSWCFSIVFIRNYLFVFFTIQIVNAQIVKTDEFEQATELLRKSSLGRSESFQNYVLLNTIRLTLCSLKL